MRKASWIIAGFKTILDWKAIVIAILAVVATYLCRRYDIIADFPLTIIATAVIFPIVFSISGAYKRREAALREYGNLKAHGRAVFFATRDWVPETDAAIQDRAKKLLGEMLVACRDLLQSPIYEMDGPEEKVYAVFSQLSEFIKSFREKGLSAGEVSRCNQFLSKMIVSFENIKHIYQYRTPRTLRAYSRFFICVLPIVYGPYFADISENVILGLPYVMPVLFSIVLVSLENIQQHLENPFDQIGADDVAINAEKFMQRLDLQ